MVEQLGKVRRDQTGNIMESRAELWREVMRNRAEVGGSWVVGTQAVWSAPVPREEP